MPSQAAPLLSLCIPTFNRAWYLEKALDCLCSQRIFQETDAVEICVSDNASSDDTPAVLARYQARYGNKVKFRRNAQNVYDKNFELALALGSGTYLKLCNDTAWFKPGMLEAMLGHIARWQEEKPVLFFKETTRRHGTTELCGLDAFVDAASYSMCSTNSFGIWKEDFDSLADFSRFSDRRFAQTDVLLRLIAQKQRAVIIRDDFFTAVWPPSKGGYNFAQLFGDNYISLLRENGVGPAALRREQVRSLRHIVRYYFDFDGHYRFHKTGYLPFMRSYYRLPEFWLSFLRVARKKAIAASRKALCSRLALFRRKWKNFHPFNELRPGNTFPMLAVYAGRHASGPLHVEAAEDAVGVLCIEDDVELGEDVRFLCGERPISVGQAARIGKGARICEGVSIGMGAVILPGSVVEGAIPAFSLAEGSPARVVGWRLPPELREELEGLGLSAIAPAGMGDARTFFAQLSPGNVQERLEALRR